MGKKINLTDHRYNKLLVLEETDERRSGSVVWRCICDCGNTCLVSGTNLTKLKTQSCGCLSLQRLAEGRVTTHGASETFEYNCWKTMKARCYNTRTKRFERYGGRGIKVSDYWLNSFENFFKDMGEAPENTSLDRIDVNGDYCKENCRWADIFTQNFNQGMRKNNTSGKTGVSWNEERQKWVASICLRNNPTSLGRFDTYEEAVKVREKAEMEYMGVTKN
jgi:hypothetical protein